MSSYLSAYIKKYKWRIIRFILVGATTFFQNMALIWLFYENFGFDNRISVSGAYVITVATHFLLNRSFTYSRSAKTVGLDLVKYSVMVFVNYLITLAISIVVVEFLGLSIYLGGMISIFFNGLSSFLIMNHFVFNEKLGITK